MICTYRYQINARTELAVRYDNRSPLENHHCTVTFDILSRPECDILAGLSDDHQREAVRKDLTLLILATDMAKHSDILNEFKARFNHFEDPDPEDRTYLKMILIKACDVSNELRPADVSEPWVDRLLQEYFMQTDREKRSGLPFAPFMDPDRVTKSSSQIGFIRFVLLPLFEAISQVHFPMMCIMFETIE